MTKQIYGKDAHYARTTAAGPASVQQKNRPPTTTTPATAAAPALPVARENSMVLIGFNCAADAFSRRNWSSIETYVSDANSANPLRRRNGLNALLGTAFCLRDILEQVGKSGAIRLTGTLPSRDDLVYAFSTDLQRFNALVQAVAEAANRVMDVRGISVSVPPSAKRNEEKDPVRVEIVSMPARETATKVRRDPAGDITSSVQFEQDVAK